jgi:hypothetical protein
MRTFRSLLTVVFLLAVAAPALLRAQTIPPGQEDRQAANVQALLELDKTSPPPANGILFTGSSIFRQWTTVAEDMAPLPAYNRAFGGSRTWEINLYMDKVVLPYRPTIIVYYCGSNDVAAGESADAIFERFREFERRVHRALPQTRIYFFSINRAIDLRNRWDVIDQANAMIKQYAYRVANLDYIESNTVLFDARDEPLTALFRPDGRHFNPPAYAEFTKLIKPVLLQAYQPAASTNN